MNIMFYQHQYPAFGGIESVTTILANAFTSEGHKVAIVSFIKKDGTDLLDRLQDGIIWRQLPETEPNSLRNKVAMLSILRGFKPDRIIFQDSYANIQDLLFETVQEWRNHAISYDENNDTKFTPTIAIEHNAPRISRRENRTTPGYARTLRQIAVFLLKPYLLLRRFSYESQRRKTIMDNSSAYIVLSRNYFPMIRRLVGASRMGKIHAIPNPVVGDPIKSISEKKMQILFVGSLIPIKGVYRLLDIWQRIEDRNRDWEFVIVGDGTERIHLQSMAADRKLHSVRFEGFTKDSTPYFRAATIFVMASDFEGWPMVLGEAMRQGCIPVVFDSFAAVHDMIDDGVNGRIIPSFRTAKFAAALEDLMCRAGIRAEMATAAIAKTEQFSIDAIMAKWHEIIYQTDSGTIIAVEHSAPFRLRGK